MFLLKFQTDSQTLQTKTQTQAFLWLDMSEPTQVLDGTDLLPHSQTLWKSDGRELDFPQLLNCILVITQVQFGPDQNDGRLRTVAFDLGPPFVAHIPQRGRTRYNSKDLI